METEYSKGCFLFLLRIAEEKDTMLVSSVLTKEPTVTLKCLGGLPVDRDRLNTYPWYREYTSIVVQVGFSQSVLHSQDFGI
ncbi:hypothetical protein TNCV_168431 [Trichonephila clavipes]|nr:hypothetical protein TNCV_168431 [Trichonephila clavipes]